MISAWAFFTLHPCWHAYCLKQHAVISQKSTRFNRNALCENGAANGGGPRRPPGRRARPSPPPAMGNAWRRRHALGGGGRPRREARQRRPESAALRVSLSKTCVRLRALLSKTHRQLRLPTGGNRTSTSHAESCNCEQLFSKFSMATISSVLLLS